MVQSHAAAWALMDGCVPSRMLDNRAQQGKLNTHPHAVPFNSRLSVRQQHAVMSTAPSQDIQQADVCCSLKLAAKSSARLYRQLNRADNNQDVRWPQLHLCGTSLRPRLLLRDAIVAKCSRNAD